jgi:hypothetical protein
MGYQMNEENMASMQMKGVRKDSRNCLYQLENAHVKKWNLHKRQRIVCVVTMDIYHIGNVFK